MHPQRKDRNPRTTDNATETNATEAPGSTAKSAFLPTPLADYGAYHPSACVGKHTPFGS